MNNGYDINVSLIYFSKEVFTVDFQYSIMNVKISLHDFENFYDEDRDIFISIEGGDVGVVVVNNIRDVRISKGLTQIQMAKDLQITRQTVNAIEKNKYNPSLELALKLLDYFNLPIEELFYLDGE